VGTGQVLDGGLHEARIVGWQHEPVAPSAPPFDDHDDDPACTPGELRSFAGRHLDEVRPRRAPDRFAVRLVHRDAVVVEGQL
jgi:hypothetical protein